MSGSDCIEGTEAIVPGRENVGISWVHIPAEDRKAGSTRKRKEFPCSSPSHPGSGPSSPHKGEIRDFSGCSLLVKTYTSTPNLFMPITVHLK